MRVLLPIVGYELSATKQSGMMPTNVYPSARISLGSVMVDAVSQTTQVSYSEYLPINQTSIKDDNMYQFAYHQVRYKHDNLTCTTNLIVSALNNRAIVVWLFFLEYKNNSGCIDRKRLQQPLSEAKKDCIKRLFH